MFNEKAIINGLEKLNEDCMNENKSYLFFMENQIIQNKIILCSQAMSWKIVYKPPWMLENKNGTRIYNVYRIFCFLLH